MRTLKALAVIALMTFSPSLPLAAQEKAEIIVKSERALILRYRGEILLTASPISPRAREYFERFHFDAGTMGRWPNIEFKKIEITDEQKKEALVAGKPFPKQQPYQFLINGELFQLTSWKLPAMKGVVEFRCYEILSDFRGERPTRECRTIFMTTPISDKHAIAIKAVPETEKLKKLSLLSELGYAEFLPDDPRVFVLDMFLGENSPPPMRFTIVSIKIVALPPE